MDSSDIGQGCRPFFASTLHDKGRIFFWKKASENEGKHGHCDMGNGSWQAMGVQTEQNQ